MASRPTSRPNQLIPTVQGSSKGRTPAVTSEEISVRIRDPEPSNQWTDAVGSNAGPDRNPGIEPRSSDHFSKYSTSKAVFLGPASGHSRHLTD